MNLRKKILLEMNEKYADKRKDIPHTWFAYKNLKVEKSPNLF